MQDRLLSKCSSVYRRLEGGAALDRFSATARWVVAKSFAVINWAMFAAGLNSLESGHWQPLIRAPPGVSLILGHKRTSETFVEVLVAFAEQETCGIFRWDATVQCCENGWCGCEQVIDGHRIDARSISKHTRAFHHPQASETCDASAGQTGIWPVEQYGGDCEEGDVYACRNFGY